MTILTLITILPTPDKPGRVVERDPPKDDAEFWRQSEAWLTRYPSPPMSEKDQADMNWRYEQVRKRLIPQKGDK